MNRDTLLKEIYDVIEFITNGKVIHDDEEYHGHPNFYVMHSREEMEDMLNSIIIDKEQYDKYDLYYYLNYIFKYMLDQHDSHTQAFLNYSRAIPVKIKFIDGVPYIVDCNDKFNAFKGAQILKINSIDIDVIVSELEKIICYASRNYLKIILEYHLADADILQSLPFMEKKDIMTFSTSKGNIEFDLNNLDEYHDTFFKDNYDVEIVDDIAIITYASCTDEDGMKNMIECLKKQKGINKYVVDLRGNGGGFSSINKSLIEFLKGKDVVAICDECTFSSAIMCLVDLKNIGAKIIGCNPGAPINSFGNCVMQKELDDLDILVRGSATYWYYDDELQCHGIYKGQFEDELRNHPDLLEPIFVEVDDEVGLTLDDYVNKTDSVLEYAISCCKGNKIKK